MVMARIYTYEFLLEAESRVMNKHVTSCKVITTMLSWAGLDLPQDLRFSIQQLDDDQGPKSAVKLSFTSRLQCDA